MFARLAPLLLAGCATTWITTQATGTQRVWDESVNEVHVPQPGIEEHLTVTMPLATGSAAPLSLTCAVDQTGRDLVYHQAFRYGSRWKKMTAAAFLLEGALGAVFLLTATNEKPDGYLYGGFLAADAVVTLPLFFIPRKEIYRTDDVAVTSPLRGDCPDGLALEIGRDTFPIDATGHVGELGEAAFAQRTPGDSLRVTINGQARDLACGPQSCTTTIPVAAGTFTSVSALEVSSPAP
jgi:hypothetical protein